MVLLIIYAIIVQQNALYAQVQIIAVIVSNALLLIIYKTILVHKFVMWASTQKTILKEFVLPAIQPVRHVMILTTTIV